MSGGDGADLLFGQGGADRLIATVGLDVLGGGGGVDTFFFSSGQCLIRDFDPATESSISTPTSASTPSRTSTSSSPATPGDVVFSFGSNTLGLYDVFLLTLRDSGVRFAADGPAEANHLTVGIMALVAQAEREAISRRTKEALALARSRGVRLGNSNEVAALRRAGKGGSGKLRCASAKAELLPDQSLARWTVLQSCAALDSVASPARWPKGSTR